MTKAATPDSSKIQTQINQMEKRLDQALELAIQPAQLDMTDLIEILAAMIHRLMTKFLPQQQMKMQHLMFLPQQMNYHQPQQCTIHLRSQTLPSQPKPLHKEQDPQQASRNTKTPPQRWVIHHIEHRTLLQPERNRDQMSLPART
jgi:hypothetical protein